MSTGKLVMASIRVLREHKRLVLFPVLSIIAMLAVAASLWLPVALTLPSGPGGTGLPNAVGYVLLALGYYAMSVASVFFNAALIFAVDQVLRGEDTGIRIALRATLRRTPAILGWALISCTISLILRTFDRKVEIAAVVLDISWSLFAFLALPAIVLGGTGVRKSASETRQLFKRGWLEEIVGSIRIHLMVLVLAIPVLPILFVGFGRSTEFSMLTSLAVSALWMGLVALFASTVNGVFRTVVYHYAKTGTIWPRFAGIGSAKGVPPGGYAPGFLEWTSRGTQV
jgi:Family of unknown function (DUF6159)